MQRNFIISLFAFTLLVSCSTWQAMPTATAIATFDGKYIDAKGVEYDMPNKLSVFGDRRISFDNWHLSFLFPKEWDINTLDKNLEYGWDNGFKIEHYDFYGPDIDIGNNRKDYADLTFQFHPFANNLEKSTYLTTIKNETEDPEFKIIDTYSSKQLGVNWNLIIGYKCQYNYVYDKTCYLVRAVYQNSGIEIWMVSDSTIFQQVQPQFLEILKSLSFGQ